MKALKINYLPATTYLGSRMKIEDLDTGEVRVMPYDYNFNNVKDAASNVLLNMHYELVHSFQDKNNLYLVAEPVHALDYGI